MFDYLDKSVDEKLTSALFLANHPEWKPLREDERFKKLLVKIGLINESLKVHHAV